MKQIVKKIMLALVLVSVLCGCAVENVKPEQNEQELVTPDVEPEKQEILEMPEKELSNMACSVPFTGGITMWVGRDTAMVNSVPAQMPAAPFLENGLFFFPVEFTARTLGWDYSFEDGIFTIARVHDIPEQKLPYGRKAEAKRCKESIQLEIGSRSMVPADQQSFDTVGLQGSMQEVLNDNIGAFVNVEFLIGTQNIVNREGRLDYVGTGYIVLFQENGDYVVCDVYSIKFVTFLTSRVYPRGMDDAPSSAQYMSPAQAAYSHAVRRRK